MKNTNWRLINENILNVSRVLNNLLDSVNELDVEWLVRNTNGTVTDVKIPNLAKSISIVRNDLQEYIDIHVYTKTEADGRFVNVTGDTMSGPLIVAVDSENRVKIDKNEIRLYSKFSDDDNRRYGWLNIFDDGSGLEVSLMEDNSVSTSALTKLFLTDNGEMYLNNNTVWHAGNDGINSLLDAGYLAGKKGNEYSLLNRSYCYGALPTYSNIDQNTVRWNESLRCITLQSNTDVNIGMAFPVFSVIAGEKYEFYLILKSTINSDTGLYIRMQEYNSEMPDDKFIIGSNDTDPYTVKYDSHVSYKSNGSVTDTWTIYKYTYTPNADVKYANILILNWEDLGDNPVYIKRPEIKLIKTLDSDKLDNLDSSSYLKNNDTSTGSFSTTDTIQAGRGSGGVALTVNDGYGNANVTFNHKDGVPEQDGNAGRITLNTDATTGASMVFQLAENVAKGVKRSIGNTLSLSKTLATFFIDVKVPKITFDSLETIINTTAYQFTSKDNYLDLRMGSTNTGEGVRYRDYDETVLELNRHKASKFLKGVNVKELGFTTSNTKKISKQFVLDNYFTQDEYLEIATITPSADSRDYSLIGTIHLITGPYTIDVKFIWGVRSNTLPDISTALEYNYGADVTLYSLEDNNNGIAKLYLKKTSSGNINSVVGEMHLLQRVDVSDYDFSNNTEKTSLPDGFTVVETTKYMSEHGNYNIEGILRTSKGININNEAIVSSNDSDWTDLFSTNIDHIWHDDSKNIWNFVSDSSYKQSGNSIIGGGSLSLNGENSNTNPTLNGYTIAAKGKNWYQTIDTTPNVSMNANYIDYNLSGSDALTADRIHTALNIDVDSSATGGDTSNEHRVYGISLNVKITGDSDNNTGIYSVADGEPSEGQISEQRGMYGLSVSKGNVINSYGTYGISYTDNTGTLTTSYGGFFKSFTTDDGGIVKTAVGVRGEVEHNNTNSSIDLAIGVQGIIDNNVDGDDIKLGYLFYGSYEGSLPSTAWGIYITTAVNNYFKGEIWTDSGLRTDLITPKTGQQLILNAGESKDKVSGQTNEYVYINAESGLSVNTPDSDHSNWESGYSVEETIIKGSGITIKGNKVWHAGNDGVNSGLDTDLFQGLKLDTFTNSSFLLKYTSPAITQNGWSLGNPSANTIVVNAPSGNSITFTNTSASTWSYGTIDNVLVKVIGTQDGDVYGEIFDSSDVTSSVSYGSNGYRMLKDGTIEQWGIDNSTIDAAEDFLFNVSFPNACVYVNTIKIGAGSYPLGVTNVSESGFTIDRNNNIEGTVSFYWEARGN